MAGAAAWTPPIGIPEPEFGIHDSHERYAGEPGYRDSGHGPYTIYVDNTAPACSDSGPATAEEPRCSLPDSLPDPGAVVEVHGGPYVLTEAKPVLTSNGSRERPIFIRGVDDGNGFPEIRDASTFGFDGSYVVVENLVFVGTSVRTGGPGRESTGGHHIALRNLEIRNQPDKNGSGLGGEHIVFYRNHVHHNTGDDRHGTTVARGSSDVWIVDNYYHHNGGDAVQFCHRCRKDPPRRVFVGRNLMHSDRENAVDLKFGKYIVISENTMHGYRRARPDTEWCFDDNSYCGTFSSGSDGSAIVVGSDGAPKHPWILYNRIYDSEQGIRIEEVRDAWIIGNTIHDIDNRALSLQKDGDPLYILDNVIYDVTTGIDQYWRDKFGIHVHGNVFANVSQRAISINGRVASRSTIGMNQFWNDEGDIRVHWGRGRNGRSKPGSFDVSERDDNLVGDPAIRVADDGSLTLHREPQVAEHAARMIAEQEAAFREDFGDGASLRRPAIVGGR